MVSLLLTLNAVICVALIILILLQRSEAGSGGMFGGAGSGSQNVVRNPLAKPTAVLAGLFLLFSVLAAVLNKGEGHGSSVMVETHDAATPATPALPDAAMGAPVSGTTLDSLLATPTAVTPTETTSPTAK